MQQMSENSFSKILKRSIFNKDSLYSLFIPLALYLSVFNIFGLHYSVLASGIYAALIATLRKSSGYISFAFFIFGVLDILIAIFVPTNYLNDIILIKMALGSVQSALLFVLFSIIKKPLPQVFAEAATPELKSIPIYGMKCYELSWQMVSGIWIIGYLLKAILLFLIYPVSEQITVWVKISSGGPFHIILLSISIIYIQRSIEFNSSKLQTK